MNFILGLTLLGFVGIAAIVQQTSARSFRDAVPDFTLNCQSSPCTCTSPDGLQVTQGEGQQVKTCKCLQDRFIASPKPGEHRVGGYIPQCDMKTGFYLPMQMHGGTGFSWCADKFGNHIGDATRNSRSLNCK